MKAQMKFGDKFEASIEKSAGLKSGFSVKSVWDWECWRDGKLLWRDRTTNVVTDQGLNSILDIMFHASTQITTWYIAIFESNYTPLVGDTYAVPGYTESTAYDEATRPAFVEAAASGKSITNSASRASFTMNATKTIYGGALVGGGTDPNTKGDTAGVGTLFCASKFSSSKAVIATDVLKVTVTLTGSDV